MTTTPMVAPTFSDDQLARLLATMKDSDSIELKLTVAASQQRSTLLALGIDPLEAQIRVVVFFDTPELTLDQHGVVVRARRVQGKGDDSIVKLRPVVPGDLPAKLRRSRDFRVEVDALPGGFVCSGTLKSAMPPTDVKAALAGDLPVRKLVSKEQRELFAAHAPDGLTLDDLTVLGLIFVLKLRFSPERLARLLVAKMWLYPDGSRVLELSTRCATNEAFQIAAEARAFLTSHGVDLTGRAAAEDPQGARVLRGAAGRVNASPP